MKISYVPAFRTNREIQEFTSYQEYERWLETQKSLAFGEECQGLGDGSINDLQIQVIIESKHFQGYNLEGVAEYDIPGLGVLDAYDIQAKGWAIEL